MFRTQWAIISKDCWPATKIKLIFTLNWKTNVVKKTHRSTASLRSWLSLYDLQLCAAVVELKKIFPQLRKTKWLNILNSEKIVEICLCQSVEAIKVFNWKMVDDISSVRDVLVRPLQRKTATSLETSGPLHNKMLLHWK